MSGSRCRKRNGYGRVKGVRFVEVEFEAPVGTRMIIELEGGLRLLVADDQAVELAAKLLHALTDLERGIRGRRGDRR